MYHTQERRTIRLTSPVLCERSDAWLGNAYYFWDDIVDAERWGDKSKKRTGSFEIYASQITVDNFLDTVFNEDHYLFYKKQIEKVSKTIEKKARRKASIKDIAAYINEKAWLGNLDGILFQDLPIGYHELIPDYPYRKRIQAAVYNIDCVLSFIFIKDEKCITI